MKIEADDIFVAGFTVKNSFIERTEGDFVLGDQVVEIILLVGQYTIRIDGPLPSSESGNKLMHMAAFQQHSKEVTI